MWQIDKCSQGWFISDTGYDAKYLRPDKTISHCWCQDFFKSRKSAQKFLDQYLSEQEKPVKLEVGKKYITGCGYVVKCIYVGYDMNRYQAICLKDNTLYKYTINGNYYTNNVSSARDIIKEYIEPRTVECFVVLIMIHNVLVPRIYYSQEEVTKLVDKPLAINKITITEGEFDT